MKKKIILLLVIISLLTLLTRTSLAKYAYKKINNLYFESHKFYFESDKLGFDTKYTDTLWDGKSVHFSLMNNTGGRVTEQDINYEVKCEVLNSNIPCNLNDTGKNVITKTLSHSEICINNKDDIELPKYNKTECELNGYEWKKIKTDQDIYFDVDLDNAVVKITATSLSPYKKELTATFNLIKNIVDTGTLKKELNILEDSAILVITNTYEDKKCVLVEFDNNKSLVDVKKEMYDIKSSNEYVNSFKINIEGMNSEKITFYNPNLDNNFDIDNYTINISNGCG